MLDNFDNTPGEKAVAQAHGLTIKVGHVQPKARGTLRLSSKDPKDLPVIDPNYLGHQEDIDANIRAYRPDSPITTTSIESDCQRSD